MFYAKKIIGFLFLMALAGFAQALTPKLVSDDFDRPWGMTFLEENVLLVTEKEGRVKLFDLASGNIQTLSGAPEVKDRGQGGLLDVAVRPGYQKGDWIYFTYSESGDGGSITTLARAKLDSESNALKEWQILLATESASGTGRHFGSRIVFSEEHLFFSVGDRGYRPNGQDLSTHAGSILRLNIDGSVPADNPFVGVKDALPEIWSYGHRNPQGLAYDFDNQRLWAIEHGPRGGDEINLIEKGGNYGWATVSLGKEYSSPSYVGETRSHPDMLDAKKIYIPSIAPSSLLFYSDDTIPELKGKLLAGALKLMHLNVLTVEASNVVNEDRLFDDLNERIRALAVNENGQLYFATDSGDIWQITDR